MTSYYSFHRSSVEVNSKFSGGLARKSSLFFILNDSDGSVSADEGSMNYCCTVEEKYWIYRAPCDEEVEPRAIEEEAVAFEESILTWLVKK